MQLINVVMQFSGTHLGRLVDGAPEDASAILDVEGERGLTGVAPLDCQIWFDDLGSSIDESPAIAVDLSRAAEDVAPFEELSVG